MLNPMPIRKQTLEEWFLGYQLQKLSKRHFHIPASVDVDVSLIANHYNSLGLKTPYTAILVKAVALTAKQNPLLNRMYFPSLWNAKIVEFDYCNVNLPIIIEDAGKSYVSAITLKEPQNLKISEIYSEIKKAKSIKIKDTKVTKFVVGKNNIFKRLMLRLIYFVVFNFPKVYVSNGGGGLSVSSLHNLDDTALDMRFAPFGFTAVTFGLVTIKRDQAKTIMKIGVGYDHMACRGDEFVEALRDFSRILTSSPELLSDFQ
jgi:hypothetical protein